MSGVHLDAANAAAWAIITTSYEYAMSPTTAFIVVG